MSGGDQYATIADVIRIVESAEFFSRCHGDWQQRTLRVPREQPDASPPSEGKSAEAKCTCKCRWESHAGYASIEQVDPACPLHGKGMPAQGGAQDAAPAEADEIDRLAYQYATGIAVLALSAKVRAIVAKRVAAARAEERKRAADMCRRADNMEANAAAPCSAEKSLNECADAIEREGGKGR